MMTEYEVWCEREGLDPDDEQSREWYDEEVGAKYTARAQFLAISREGMYIAPRA